MKCLDGKVEENRTRNLSPGRTQLRPLNTGYYSPGKLKALKLDGDLGRKFFRNKESESHRWSTCLTPSPNTKKSLYKGKDPSVLEHINSKFEKRNLELKQRPLNSDYLVAFNDEFLVYKEFLEDLSHLVCGLNIEIHKSIMRGLGCISAVFNRVVIKCAQRKTEVVLMKSENKARDKNFCEVGVQTDTDIVDFDELELDNIRTLSAKMKNINLSRVTNRLIEVNNELVGMCGGIPKVSEAPFVSGQAYYRLLKKVLGYLKVIDRSEKCTETDDLQCSEASLEQEREITEKIIEDTITEVKLIKSVNEVVEQGKSEGYFDSNQAKIFELELEIGELKRRYNKLLNETSIIKGNVKKTKATKMEKETNVCNVVFTEVYLKCIEDIEAMKFKIKEMEEKLWEIEGGWMYLVGKDFVYADFEVNKKNFLSLNIDSGSLPDTLKKKTEIFKETPKKVKKLKVFLKTCRIYEQDLKIYPKISNHVHSELVKNSTQLAISHVIQSSDSQLLTLASNDPISDPFTDSFEKLHNWSSHSFYPCKKHEENLFKVLDQCQWQVFQDYKTKKANWKLEKIENKLKINSKSTEFCQQSIKPEQIELAFYQIFSSCTLQAAHLNTKFNLLVKKKSKNPNEIPLDPPQTLIHDSNYLDSYHFKLKKFTEEHLSKKCFPPCTHLTKLSSLQSSHTTATYPISKVNII